jgi:hypothetical protein
MNSIKLCISGNKLPGADQIPAELIEAGGELRSEIHKLIKLIWNKQELCSELSCGMSDDGGSMHL